MYDCTVEKMSFAWYLWYWMLFAPLVLPVSQTLMPESCDEPARIVVDVHQPGYTVEFRVCEDEGAPCSCSTDDHSLVIVSARLYSDDLTYNLSYGAETFDVVLPQPHMSVGVHHYKVDCEYECVFPIKHSHCKSQTLDIFVEIVDFKLKLVGTDLLKDDSNVKKAISQGSHVTMTCSSGLDNTQGSNSSDIKTQFLFTSEGGDTNKSVDCDKEPTTVDDWFVTRQDVPPYNCLLNITNFDSENVGEYSCTAFLPRGSSHYVMDPSPSSIQLSLKGQGTGSSSTLKIIIASVVVVVVAMVLLVALLGLAYRVRGRHRLRGRVTPYTSITSRRSPRQNYGATGEQLSIDGESRTLVEGETEASLSEDDFETSFNPTPVTVVEVILPSPPSPSPPPRPPPSEGVGGDQEISNASSRSSLLKVESENEEDPSRSRLSTMSEGREGAAYYNDHMEIHRPEEGRVTPNDPDVPFDDNYTCEHCGKKYRTNERLFYKRHIDELQTRCSKFTPGHGPAAHPSLSAINIPPIGSNLNIPDILVPKNEDKKEDKEDKSLQASGSDVDSLSFMTESSEPRPPSTAPTTLSSGPPSSVGEEGQKIYDKIMRINPATGPTPPESHFPINPHYTCPHCGKGYHGDQRLFFVRHCDTCSGGSEQQS